MRKLLGVLVVVLAACGLTPPIAHAAPITGTVIVIPGEGADIAAIRLRTSAGCPQQSKAYYARLWGKGFPEAGQVVTTNTSAGIRHDAGFDVYFAQTMKDFAALAGGVTLGGTYKISVYCIDKFPSQVQAEFTGSLEFTTPKQFRALGTSKPDGTPPAPLDQGGVELPEQQGANPSAAPGAAPGQQPAGPAQAGANSVPAESNTNLILLFVCALLVGPAIWLALRLLRRRTPATETSKGSHD
jgi:hypothetical protein